MQTNKSSAEMLADNARLLTMKNAQDKYEDAVNRGAPQEVLQHYLNLYIEASENYATARIEGGHHG